MKIILAMDKRLFYSVCVMKNTTNTMTIEISEDQILSAVTMSHRLQLEGRDWQEAAHIALNSRLVNLPRLEMLDETTQEELQYRMECEPFEGCPCNACNNHQFLSL
jgi:hypothetical protein